MEPGLTATEELSPESTLAPNCMKNYGSGAAFDRAALLRIVWSWNRSRIFGPAANLDSGIPRFRHFPKPEPKFAVLATL